jgi:hypothetical protein
MGHCAAENTAAVHGRDTGSRGAAFITSTVLPDTPRKAWKQQQGEVEYERHQCVRQLLEKRLFRAPETANCWSMDRFESKDEKQPPIGKPVADTVHGVVNAPGLAVRDGGEMGGLNSAMA